MADLEDVALLEDNGGEQEESAPPPDSDPLGGEEAEGEGGADQEDLREDSNPDLLDDDDLTFSYLKNRENFGRQQQCLADHWRMHAVIKPHRRHQRNVVRKRKIHKETQSIPTLEYEPMNTIRAEYRDFKGMHTEGGWPKDVNFMDPDSTARHRKKLDKDEEFQASVPIMVEQALELIKNNNTIDFYKDSFQCKRYVGERDLRPVATVVNVFKNPCARKRPVRRISFAPDHQGRMAVAMAPFPYARDNRKHPGEAYFWEVEIPSRPEAMVRGPSHIMDVRYHPKDLHSIVGALYNGQVATWDARVGPNPQALTSFEVSHTDMCTSALWINSKTGTEFFSAGMDGQVIYWDERNLSEKLDVIWCDPEKGQNRQENAVGCTSLNFESTLPTKFLAGTEKGQVMVFMKKGKSPNDRLVNVYKAHKGPVRSINRNPMFVKNFLTVGDFQLRIFAEDCRDSNIMWTKSARSKYMDANWIPTRPAAFVGVRVDGTLEFRDLMIHGIGVLLKIQVSHEVLTACCASDMGKHIAVGTRSGDIRFVKITDFMGEFDKPEKPQLAALFERESRREKYLEQRHREIRLRKRDADKKAADKLRIETEKQAARTAAGYVGTTMDVLMRYHVKTDPIIEVERAFFLAVEEEIKTQGLDAFPDKREKVEVEVEPEPEPKPSDDEVPGTPTVPDKDEEVDVEPEEERKPSVVEAQDATAVPDEGEDAEQEEQEEQDEQEEEEVEPEQEREPSVAEVQDTTAVPDEGEDEDENEEE